MSTPVRFRVAPRVRLQVARSGPRVSIGPPVTRVCDEHPAPTPGTGTATSAATGELSATWSRRAGGGRVASAAGRTARRADSWASVRSYLDDLRSAHTVPVTRSTRPTATTPEPTTARAVRRDLTRRRLAGRPWWHLAARWRAGQAADRDLDAEVARRRARSDEHAASGRQEADAWWDRLVANDPEVVTAHLDRALTDHAMPATVTAVEGDTVHLVVPVLTVEKLIGPREPKATDGGEPVLKRVTKARRHALFEAAVTSMMLAVAAEVFALAPGIARVSLAVLAPRHLGGPAVLMLAELPRDVVLPDGSDRSAETDLVDAAARGRVTLVRDKGGRVGALRPLEDDDPSVRSLLEALELV